MPVEKNPKRNFAGLEIEFDSMLVLQRSIKVTQGQIKRLTAPYAYMCDIRA